MKLVRCIFCCWCCCPRERKIDQDVPLPKLDDEEDFVYSESMENYDLEIENFEKILKEQLTEDQIQSFYISLSYAVHNYFGKPTNFYCATKEDLKAFIKKITFGEDLFDTSELDIKAQKLAPPRYILEVTIKEAKNLIPTDADGQSDSYCKVWLGNDARKHQKTITIDNTRDPKWNETFEFRIKNMDKDKLYAEVWDEDPTGVWETVREIRNVSSLRGCWLLFWDVGEVLCCENVDDFIGRTEIEVKNINSEKFEKWLVLKDKTGREENSGILISAHFKVQVPVNYHSSLKCHLLLCKKCALDSLEEEGKVSTQIYSWEEILNPVSLTLLFQHGVQIGLNKYEDLVCQWVTIDYLVSSGKVFSYSLFYVVLQEIYTLLLEGESYNIDALLEQTFISTLIKFLAVCFKMIEQLHSLQILHGNELEFIIRCIYEVHNILGDESLNTYINPCIALQMEAKLWYKDVVETVLSELKGDSSKSAQLLLEILGKLHVNQVMADSILRNLDLEQTYTDLTLEHLSSTISKDLKPHISKIAKSVLKAKNKDREEKMQAVVALYVSLKDLWHQVEMTVTITVTESVELRSFREWFGIPVVQALFHWQEEEVLACLDRCIEKDTFVNEEPLSPEYIEEFKRGTSVCDLMKFITEKLCEMWKIIEWPILDCSAILIQSLYNCVHVYSDLLLMEIEKRKLFENFFDGGSQKIAAVANNLYALATFADEVVRGRVEEIPADVPNSKEFLETCCENLCQKIAQEMHDDITEQVKKVVTAKSMEMQDKMIEAYTTFLDELLRNTYDHMKRPVFIFFLKSIWVIAVDAIKCTTEAAEEDYFKNVCLKIMSCKWRKAIAFHGLLKALHIARDLAHDDGHGLTEETLRNSVYVKLEADLEAVIAGNKPDNP